MKYMAIVTASLLAACQQDGTDEILNKDPFTTEVIANPPDGSAGIIARSQNFAEAHQMRIQKSENHSLEGEYAVSLTRNDINIVASNVGRGHTSAVRGYKKDSPDDNDFQLIKEFECRVLMFCKPR